MPELNAEPMYDITDENISKIRELIDAPFVSFRGIENIKPWKRKLQLSFVLQSEDINLATAINAQQLFCS